MLSNENRRDPENKAQSVDSAISMKFKPTGFKLDVPFSQSMSGSEILETLTNIYRSAVSQSDFEGVSGKLIAISHPSLSKKFSNSFVVLGMSSSGEDSLEFLRLDGAYKGIELRQVADFDEPALVITTTEFGATAESEFRQNVKPIFDAVQ